MKKIASDVSNAARFTVPTADIVGKIGANMTKQGSSLVLSGNRSFWAAPYATANSEVLAGIAKAANLRDTGQVLAAFGMVGKGAGIAGNVLDIGILSYQLLTNDHDAAVRTAGNIVGSAIGGAAGTYIAGVIVTSTGVGAPVDIIIIIATAAVTSFAGGILGEHFAPPLVRAVNDFKPVRLTQAEINQRVSMFLPR